MKFRIPVIGEVAINEPPESDKAVKEVTEKLISGGLGGLFNFESGKLSDFKTASSKLLAANVGWVYRNNDVIAKEVSNMELELFKVTLVKGELEYTKLDSHPLLDVLDKFNDNTTLSDGLYITQSHKKLTGDAFWLVIGRQEKIKAFYTLPPDKIELMLGDPAKGQDLVEGYKYKDTIDGKKVEKTYTPKEIMHFRSPNPNNPYRGLGAVEAAAEVIDTDNLAQQTMKKFFENGAIINFILTTEAKITDEQLKRLHAEFRSSWTGARNAFKVPILGGGLKPESIQPSNKEQEFLSQLEWYRDKIMVLFGNTKASLGIIDDVNRASHESSIISWRKNSIKPEMEAIVNTLNEFLVPKFGQNLILTFKDPVGEDRTAIVEEAVKLTHADLITPNEAREQLGLEPRPGEVNDQTDKERPKEEPDPNEVPKSLLNVNYQRFLRQRKFYEQATEYKKVRKAAVVVARRIVEARKATKLAKVVQPTPEIKEIPTYNEHTRIADETVWKYWEKLQSISDVNFERFKNKIQQFIGRVEDEVLQNFPQEIDRSYDKQLLNEEQLIVQAQLDFEPILREIAKQAGQEAINLTGATMPFNTFNYRQTIEKSIIKFATSMIKTERDRITDIIEFGVKEGLSIPNIRSNIVREFEGFTRKQAELIARNESLRATNAATLEGFKQSGVVVGKQWLTAMDERVCPYCAPLNGKIVALNQSFFGLGSDYYGDAKTPLKIDYLPIRYGNLHVSCRCTILPVLGNNSVKLQEITEELEKLKGYTKELEKAAGIE